MTKKRKGGWYGEPWRHAQAARGIKTKGVSSEEKRLREATLEYLVQRDVFPSYEEAKEEGIIPEKPIVVDVTDQLVEDLEEWAADKIEDRLNELGFWADDELVSDAPQSEEELFNRIANSDAPDDIYDRLQRIVARDNPELTSTQMDRVANDAATAGAKLVAKAAWQEVFLHGGR